MTLVLDAQPVVAFFQGEPGASTVAGLLERVHAGREEAWMNVVNLAEVRYLLLRRAPEHAAGHLAWIERVGVRRASADALWEDAAAIKATHAMSLADAFALATALDRKATLVAGDDPDFDAAGALGVRLQRI